MSIVSQSEFNDSMEDIRGRNNRAVRRHQRERLKRAEQDNLRMQLMKKYTGMHIYEDHRSTSSYSTIQIPAYQRKLESGGSSK